MTAGLVVHPAVIRANLEQELPFMATENVIMRGAKAGVSRQDLHERIRQHSHAAAARMKTEGVPADLLERMRADPTLAPHVTDEVLDPALYTGRAAAQVQEFLGEVLDPLLETHADRRGKFAPRVRV